MMTTEDPYAAYASDPTPDNLFATVKSVRPAVDYTLRSLGAADDPYMRARADVIAAEAVKTYDPTKGAKLETHIGNQLKRLYRERRQRRSPIPVADRMQLDKMSVQRATEDLEEEYGRDPTMEEIAERAQMSLRRLSKVNAANVAIGTEGAAQAMGLEGGAVTETDWDQEAVEYVYGDVDRTDKKILEWKLGLFGAPKLPPKEIAARLGLKPYQLTRRSIRMANQINEIIRDLREVNAV